MAKTIWILCCLVGQFSASAQKQDPVHFDYSVKQVKEKTYELHIKATPDEGWHIYSQTQPEEAIAVPTKIVFNKNPLLAVSGKAKEIGEKERYDDKQAGIVQYQYRKVEFVQTIIVKSTVKTNVSGTITYQACTDERCLPPKTVNFSLVLN